MVDELVLLRQLLEADPRPDDPGLADLIKARLALDATPSLAAAARGPATAKASRRARPSWRQRRVVVLGGVAGGLLAAAVPVGLHVAGGPTGAGTTIRLASYSLRLPAIYHQVSSGPSLATQGSCSARLSSR